MAAVLSPGDSSGSDAFSFVFLREVEAGITINFTDHGRRDGSSGPA
jgi:hypothetical protein